MNMGKQQKEYISDGISQKMDISLRREFGAKRDMSIDEIVFVRLENVSFLE